MVALESSAETHQPALMAPSSSKSCFKRVSTSVESGINPLHLCCTLTLLLPAFPQYQLFLLAVSYSGVASAFRCLGRLVGNWPFLTIVLSLALTAALGYLGMQKFEQEWSPYDLYVPKGASTAQDREIIKDTFGYFPLMVGRAST